MTAASVVDGLPVATGLAVRPNSLMNARTMESVDEPLAENAMVLPAVSSSVRIEDVVLEYQ